MDRARVKTMHVILVCTQTFAQLALDRAEAGIALMEGMIDVATNAHECVILPREKKLPWYSACSRTRI